VRYGNCLIWALKQWVTKGGYIAFRRGVQFGGWYVHFLWAKDLKGPWRSYDAIHDKKFPWPVFRGHVVLDDAVQELYALQKKLGNPDPYAAFRETEGFQDMDDLRDK
jgi:hypothetical protein